MSALPNIQSLFGGVSASIDRLPMFRAVFERAASTCAQELRAFAISPPQLTVASVESGAAAEVFAQHDGAIAAGTLQAAGWNARLLISARRGADEGAENLGCLIEGTHRLDDPEHRGNDAERRQGLGHGHHGVV